MAKRRNAMTYETAKGLVNYVNDLGGFPTGDNLFLHQNIIRTIYPERIHGRLIEAIPAYQTFSIARDLYQRAKEVSSHPQHQNRNNFFDPNKVNKDIEQIIKEEQFEKSGIPVEDRPYRTLPNTISVLI